MFFTRVSALIMTLAFLLPQSHASLQDTLIGSSYPQNSGITSHYTTDYLDFVSSFRPACDITSWCTPVESQTTTSTCGFADAEVQVTSTPTYSAQVLLPQEKSFLTMTNSFKLGLIWSASKLGTIFVSHAVVEILERYNVEAIHRFRIENKLPTGLHLQYPVNFIPYVHGVIPLYVSLRVMYKVFHIWKVVEDWIFVVPPTNQYTAALKLCLSCVLVIIYLGIFIFKTFLVKVKLYPDLEATRAHAREQLADAMEKERDQLHTL